MNLREIQLEVLARISAPKASEEGERLFERAAMALVGEGKRSSADQLDTYRDQFFRRHYASLREDFPTVRALLGEDLFEAEVRAFLAATPITAKQLGDVSLPFPDFIATHLLDSLRDGGGRIQLILAAAALDLAVLASASADDGKPVSLEQITSVAETDWPRAIFRFHPALRVLRLPARLHSLRVAFFADTKEPLVEEEAHVAVERRPNGAVFFEELATNERTLLELLASGVTLGAACERLTDRDPPLGAWFQRWMEHGWIVGIELREGATEEEIAP